ncbi:2-polyprenyl-6-methoxyphenol hydroxylase-like FAD-dependent oxidoreductase [Kitasatospora sp. SolWspMP-SS2h]|uniref:FAD-dependent monooxygenase n=1 Tax=Kitasatospora sp. SolWspMP-SS2h TaxID=1305729 RepID=UPI000DBAD3B7|nr:FAD-dependent monooxygenase [Kitasatospora sp. SolWspMP-SS2h]RAJ29840.1 2-polyprenyl-6-methoxyphenol hydroxylase-like FAD-dependent oxidoreductase [Kitasatospora sp. SolWspMP-SS2h]
MQQPRTVVVSGASIAGLSAAFWLRKQGWNVSVIERADSFRDGGQNVDVRGVARDVLHRMGLFDAVKAQNTTETGAVFVDRNGSVTAELPSDGPDGATAELEILRGDLARVIHDHLPDGVEFLYGDTITEVTDGSGPLQVITAGHRTLPCDLLVIAEGVRSTTRELVFPPGAVTSDDLDVSMVFGTIPRTGDDTTTWRWHTTTRGRQIHLRPDPHGTTRAMLCCSPAVDLAGLDRAQALTRLRQRFANAGWQAPRILDDFTSTDDLYIDQLTQIRMATWHRGRTVTAGDAGWCVTPMGGGGASLALTSGYVLAAQLAAHPDSTENALADYETWMRPLVDQFQTLPRGWKRFAYPQTATGLKIRHIASKALTSRPLRPLTDKLTQAAHISPPLPDMPRPSS